MGNGPIVSVAEQKETKTVVISRSIGGIIAAIALLIAVVAVLHYLGMLKL